MSAPAAGARAGRLGTWLRQQYGRERYGLVFGLLLVGYIVGSASEEWGTILHLAAVSGTLVTLAVTASEDATKTLRWLLPVLVAALAAAAAELLTVNDTTERSLGVGLVSLGLLIAPGLVVAQILRQRTVTTQTLYAAGAVYLMLGLGFGALYQAIDRITTGPLLNAAEVSSEQINYFSFVTLTTLGYGDITPVTSTGRALVVIESLIGQLFLATLVARLVAGIRSKPEAAPT